MYLRALPSRGTACAGVGLAAALALLCCALAPADGISLDLAVAATGAAAATATLMPQLIMALLTSAWAVAGRGVLAPGTGKPGAGPLRSRAAGGGLAPLLAPLLLLLCSAATPATAQDTYYQDWMSLGCFNEGNPRALPTNLGDLAKTDTAGCRDLATTAGMDTFGLQNGGECWTCNGCNWTMYGAASGCVALGGAGTNQVYRYFPRPPPLPALSYGGWTPLGCFKENVPRMLSHNLGSGFTATTCQTAGLAAGYDTVALQAGACWACLECNYAGYGTATGCPALGGTLLNQVYLYNAAPPPPTPPLWKAVRSLNALVTGVTCLYSSGAAMGFNLAVCADILKASPYWNPTDKARPTLA